MSAQDFRVKNGLVVATTTSSGNTTVTGFANVSTTLQVGTNTATFGTAVYITANGNVGIGTSSPGDARLFISSGGTANAYTGGMAGLQINNTDLTANGTSGITSYLTDPGGSSRHSAAISFSKDGTWTTGSAYPGNIGFWTRPNSTADEIERMRIDSSGNTGIGNTSPTHKLSVNGTTFLGSTLAAGNTTITGFANIVSDTAAIQVGNSTNYFTGNTTGFYPAANTLGSALGNTTARWVITGQGGTFGGTTSFAGLTVTGTLLNSGANGNYGSSTAAATYQLGYGATTTGVLKTINMGTGGAAGSTTNVNIGSTLSNTFVTINANTVTYTGAASGITTLAAGNTTITGFANVAGTVSMYSYKEQTNTVTISAGALTINAAAATTFDVSLNAAITSFTFQNLAASGLVSTFTMVFTADGTARAITWPTAVKWPNNTAPTMTSTLNKKDIFTFFTEDAGTTILAFASGQNCG
jgi:hypothetical protein